MVFAHQGLCVLCFLWQFVDLLFECLCFLDAGRSGRSRKGKHGRAFRRTRRPPRSCSLAPSRHAASNPSRCRGPHREDSSESASTSDRSCATTGLRRRSGSCPRPCSSDRSRLRRSPFRSAIESRSETSDGHVRYLLFRLTFSITLTQDFCLTSLRDTYIVTVGGEAIHSRFAMTRYR